jgi:cell division protein FtsI/penicillin-binding protein 2
MVIKNKNIVTSPYKNNYSKGWKTINSELSVKEKTKTSDKDSRTRSIGLVGLILFSIISIRIFQVQILKQDYYNKLALEKQGRSWILKADRGQIYIKDGSNSATPIVLNSTVYTLTADPTEIKDPNTSAEKISPIIGIDTKELEENL